MGARLLVIEDDDAIAALFAEVLAHEGYVVQCVGSPEEACSLLVGAGPDAFDVILSNPFADPDAPYAWLDQLRTLTGVPIVICSAWPETLYADHRARGFATYLSEPLDVDALVKVAASVQQAASRQSGGGEGAGQVKAGAERL